MFVGHHSANTRQIQPSVITRLCVAHIAEHSVASITQARGAHPRIKRGHRGHPRIRTCIATQRVPAAPRLCNMFERHHVGVKRIHRVALRCDNRSDLAIQRKLFEHCHVQIACLCWRQAQRTNRPIKSPTWGLGLSKQRVKFVVCSFGSEERRSALIGQEHRHTFCTTAPQPPRVAIFLGIHIKPRMQDAAAQPQPLEQATYIHVVFGPVGIKQETWLTRQMTMHLGSKSTQALVIAGTNPRCCGA